MLGSASGSPANYPGHPPAAGLGVERRRGRDHGHLGRCGRAWCRSGVGGGDVSAESGEGEHEDALDGEEDEGVRFTRRARRHGCRGGRRRGKSGPGGALALPRRRRRHAFPSARRAYAVRAANAALRRGGEPRVRARSIRGPLALRPRHLRRTRAWPKHSVCCSTNTANILQKYIKL